MTIFIETESGAVNLDHVVRAEFSGNHFWLHLSGDERAAKCSIHAYERAMEETAVLAWPAQAGTFVVAGYEDANTVDDVLLLTAIGWASCVNGTIQPITADGVRDGLSTAAVILHPTGSVTVCGDQEHASLEAFVAVQKRQRELAAASAASSPPDAQP